MYSPCNVNGVSFTDQIELWWKYDLFICVYSKSFTAAGVTEERCLMCLKCLKILDIRSYVTVWQLST